MDEYSNILYVKESPAAMSHLAHRVSLDDKYRPESCCIIGNYYSLSSMHEKVRAFLVSLQSERPEARQHTERPLWIFMPHADHLVLRLSSNPRKSAGVDNGLL